MGLQRGIFMMFINALPIRRRGRASPQCEVPSLRVVPLPATLQVGAAYGLAVRADAPVQAQAFAQSLTEPVAQAVLQRLGFGRP